MAEKEILVRLKLPDIYFASLMQVCIQHCEDQEVGQGLDRLLDSMIVASPEVIMAAGMRRINPHNDQTCTCHIVHVPVAESELKLLQLFYPADTAMGKLIQQALDTTVVYRVSEEIEDGMRDSGDSNAP